MRSLMMAVAVTISLAAMHNPVGAETAQVAGEVRKIDQPAAKITLKHGPITNLEMDAMTMVFRVQARPC